MVGEVCEYDELAGLFQKIDTVRITTSTVEQRIKNKEPVIFTLRLRQRTINGFTGHCIHDIKTSTTTVHG